MDNNNEIELQMKINDNIDKIIQTVFEKEFHKFSSQGFSLDRENIISLSDSSELLDTIFNKAKNSEFFNLNCHSGKRLLELLIVEHTSLFYILSNLIWDEEFDITINTHQTQRLSHLTIILNNLINNLKSLLLQLENGLLQSSYVIFRNYMELSEKSIAILVDNEYFNQYTKETENRKEEMEVWAKTKPFKTFSIVEKRLNKLYNHQDEEFMITFSDVRKKLYSISSEAVHSTLSSNIIGSFKDDKSDILNWSLLGKRDERISIALRDYIIYCRIISKSLLMILVADFKLTFNNFGEDGLSHLHLFKSIEELFPMYLNEKL